jgi:hypothetical protein
MENPLPVDGMGRSSAGSGSPPDACALRWGLVVGSAGTQDLSAGLARLRCRVGESAHQRAG